MPAYVLGTARTPAGVPIEDGIIRITALSSVGEIVESSEASIRTNIDGGYDFILQNGFYEVEVNFDDEYTMVGEVAILTKGDPSQTWTLPELLKDFKYTPPVEPPSDEV